MKFALAILIMTLSAAPALAQYNSGSSGVHGPFPPTAVPNNVRYMVWDLKTGLLRYCSAYDTQAKPDFCTTEISTAQIPGIPEAGLTNHVFEFSNVDILPSPNIGALDIYLVGYEGPTPLTILSQTSFRLRFGIVFHLDGLTGHNSNSIAFGVPGGRPGPGGFDGGAGGKQGSPSTNGNAGFGPSGGAGGVANGGGRNGGHATPTPVSTSLIPLVGGSGGGGSGALDAGCGVSGGGGAGGGGGGGAMVMAASVQITLDSGSLISARPGTGGSGCAGTGGTGGGGAVRLVATTISGPGQILVGATGILRFEGNTQSYTGNVDTSRGSVLTAPQPAIAADFPQLRITSVGGIAVGQNPSGIVSTPDVTFPTAPANPVTVELAASNVPVGTVVRLRANPVIGAPTTADSSALVGTPQSSTASAALEIPAGVGVITAVTSFPVTTALLERLPFVPGLKPTAIEVVADATGTSRAFVIGADARRVEIDWRFAVVP